jgi:two-component system, NtrC family, response regulator AtoC
VALVASLVGRSGAIPKHAILVVDDEPAICDLLRDLLEGAGYQVKCAPDGDQALAQLDREEFGLVVLDWMMPGLSGAAVLRALVERGDPVPVIILSARSRLTPETVPAAAVRHVRKPFDEDELLSAVARFCPPPGPVPSVSNGS